MSASSEPAVSSGSPGAADPGPAGGAAPAVDPAILDRWDAQQAAYIAGREQRFAAMLDVLERCFPARFDGWRTQLKEIVPSCGTSLAENPGLLAELRTYTDETLQLTR